MTVNEPHKSLSKLYIWHFSNLFTHKITYQGFTDKRIFRVLIQIEKIEFTTETFIENCVGVNGAFTMAKARYSSTRHWEVLSEISAEQQLTMCKQWQESPPSCRCQVEWKTVYCQTAVVSEPSFAEVALLYVYFVIC